MKFNSKRVKLTLFAIPRCGKNGKAGNWSWWLTKGVFSW